MFRRLAANFNPNPAAGGPAVFALTPMQLARFLEQVWSGRNQLIFPQPTGLEVPAALQNQEAASGVPLPPPPYVWKHLIYAYMIENTRVFEIFARVIAEFAFGERLGTPTNLTQRWLRTTEQLFFSADSPFQIYSFTSYVRPDPRAIRRNSYQRMFGMDLNHGTDDGRPYAYPRAAAANTDFATTWEQLLREVWRGYENRRNAVGQRPTDEAAIATLARTLDDMMRARREGGNLNREELAHTAAMSWFHLALAFDSPVVMDLEAQANAPEDRLFKIGERVGLPAHSRSGAYFRLADNMALILRAIELRQFNTPATATALYEDTPGPPPQPPSTTQLAMVANIRDWSLATGRDLKSRPVSLEAPAPVPVRAPVRPSSSPSRNGRATEPVLR